jgi:hypothetical protein
VWDRDRDRERERQWQRERVRERVKERERKRFLRDGWAVNRQPSARARQRESGRAGERESDVVRRGTVTGQALRR